MITNARYFIDFKEQQDQVECRDNRENTETKRLNRCNRLITFRVNERFATVISSSFSFSLLHILIDVHQCTCSRALTHTHKEGK